VAEEVVQDTWLFSILANRARNRAEREGRSVSWLALGDGDGEPPVDQASFHADRHWKENHAGLSEEDPELLRRFEGWKSKR
jgi:DNA-directed RNA polymerase specialized sigma24 family protein